MSWMLGILDPNFIALTDCRLSHDAKMILDLEVFSVATRQRKTPRISRSVCAAVLALFTGENVQESSVNVPQLVR